MPSQKKTLQINSIIKAIEGFSTQDYTNQALVAGIDPELDALAEKINELPFTLTLLLKKRKETDESPLTFLKEIAEYKYALDQSSIVAITDQKGFIIHANDNFCKISKYSREELIGQDHRIINSGHHSKEFIREMWQTIANGNIWKGEVKNRAKDGTVYWVDTTIVPIKDKKGKPFQYLAIRADITRRKEAEEQLKDANQELESFSYSVSHDLRAPVRAINGYAKILNNKYSSQLDDEANRLVHNIISNSVRMGSLIYDLLVFSRWSRKELVKVNINMDTMVKAICEDFKSELGERKVTFQINKLMPAQGDATTIKQVWINLISNAVKYTRPREQAIIEIGCYQKGNETVYYVKDNGVGFDIKYVDKLFGVFNRLHMQEEFEGTGVGLAIVKRIINKHGGHVWVEAKLNEGATFYFTIEHHIP